MKVFVESRFINQSRNGISRDSISILTPLLKDPNIEVQSFTFSRKNFLRGLIGLRTTLNGHPKYIDFHNELVFIPQLQGYLPKSKRTAVIRIHDIYPLTNPEWFRKMSSEIFKSTLARAVQDDHLFVCNSATTRARLLEYYPTARTKLLYCNSRTPTIIECGKCEFCSQKALFPGTPFLLTVGTVEPRKNYEMLIRIWNKAVNKQGLNLVIVGRKGWKSTKVMHQLGRRISNLVYFKDICDKGVQELTKGCAAYLSVSLGEGFNFPAMDAANLFKPLLLSDIPIHRELYGNNGKYFAPTNESQLGEVIERLDISLLEPFDFKPIYDEDFDEKVCNLFINEARKIT